MLKWFLNLFPSNRAQCMNCDHTYAKDAMRELWFRYTEDDGTEGTSSLFICSPCIEEIAEWTENQVIGYDDFEIEVDDE